MDWGWTPTADLPYSVHLAGAINDLYARLAVHAPPRDATGVARHLWEHRRRAPAGVATQRAAGPFLARNLRRAQRTRRKTEARKRDARVDASRFCRQTTSKRPVDEATQAPFMSSWFAAKKASGAPAPDPAPRPVPSHVPKAVRLRPPPRI